MSYNPEEKVYHADGNEFSINDLLRSALDPDYFANGMPRISDFHLKVGDTVRFRLDSDLQSIPGGDVITPEVAEKLIYPLLLPQHVEKLKDSPVVDIDSGYELSEEGVNFRVNAFRDRQGLAATIRLLPQSIPDVDDIGFPIEGLGEELVHLKQGLVIVSGITGSGKTTTIASLINAINEQRAARIITLEDPVENVFLSKRSLISQREVGVHLSSFQAGLKSALRENPDIIYVGEMRDMETASLAMTAAETGHLVFSTLHTRDATGVITRILDMFPADKQNEVTNQLSLSLGYVISQQLVPRADGEGRLAAMEVLKNTTGVANLIRTGKWHQIYSTIETKGNEGMITMEQTLLDLHAQGFITRENAILHANRDDIVGRLPEAQPARKKRW